MSKKCSLQVGRIEKVLVTEVSHDGNYYVAHNKSYDQVCSVHLQ